MKKRKLLFTIACLLLSSCATLVREEKAHCFESERIAREVGEDIFFDGFDKKVRASSEEFFDKYIKSVGLQWSNIESKEDYCKDGGYPIILYIEYEKAGADKVAEIYRFTESLLEKEITQRLVLSNPGSNE